MVFTMPEDLQKQLIEANSLQVHSLDTGMTTPRGGLSFGWDIRRLSGSPNSLAKTAIIRTSDVDSVLSGELNDLEGMR